ncbi:hypothetical protein NP493_916g00080 [Ridgeia piscesae]|uniref:Uncharacterized protein n=1 Tax=Ridgeia piscesae TaxID=27915 RepID=A0AAD9KKK9_RIDPI|nr:hypothetical protein NP493_916g00080 [Ridgeia piscesae]
MLSEFRKRFLEAPESHLCAVVVALVSAARQYGLDSAWAVERASQLGYPFDKEPGQPIVKLFIQSGVAATRRSSSAK